MKKVFKANGDFKAYYDAEKWLRENGYSYGSMQRDDPIGIVKGESHIEKWRNIGADKSFLDGIIASGDKRNGDVTVIIFDDVDTRYVFLT